MMPRITALAVSTIFALGWPVGSQSNARQQIPDLKEVKHGNVAFLYNPNDFAEVTIEQQRKETAQESGDGVATGLAPEHFCFHLEDKRPLPALDEGPRYFFPTDSFICAIPLDDPTVEKFGSAYPHLQHAAQRLRKMLRRHTGIPADWEDLPDFPPNDAAPSIVSRFQYLAFGSGAGILFLTQYSNEMLPNPVNNEELTLDFQGLTNDGRYYLAARLAITHPSLPRGIDFTEDIERDTHFRYLKTAEQQLDGYPENSFRPSLKRLKDLLASIHVE